METTVWVNPDLEKPFRWLHPVYAWSYLAVPGETTNRFDIAYIGRNDTIAENDDNGRFLSTDAKKLLVEWLRVSSTEAEAVELHPGRSKISLKFPERLIGRLLSYNELKVTLAPTNLLKVSAWHDGRPLKMHWPDSDKKYEIISPDNEGGVVPEDWEPAVVDGVPMWRNRKDPSRLSYNFEDRWPGRLRNLFPYGSGLDCVQAHMQMWETLSLSQTDVEGAILFARAKAGNQILPGEAPLGLSWYLPELRKSGPDGMLMNLVSPPVVSWTQSPVWIGHCPAPSSPSTEASRTD